ncbi:diguanylate cyclase, partial [Patescibacteria group bacterium]|nr:diguanylate cyclase [Patescibacteria group bacterium]
KSMQENKRENDVLVRWGGDEFILLCPGTTKEAAQKIMERVGLGIKELMEESFSNLEKPLGFTFSLEEWNQKKENFFAFIKRVDQKLIELKKQKHV